MAIYLIGGPPKCGKTTLAKRMSKEWGISWISSDTLENLAFAYSRKEDHSTLFPHSYLRGDSNDEFYSHNTPEEIVQGYMEQSKTTYPAISMMVETYLTDKDNFIIEGYQVTPEIVSQVIKKFGNEHIKPAFLVKHDERKMLKDFHKSTTTNDWILRKTKDEATFSKIARMIDCYAKHVEHETKKYDLPVYATDEDFEGTLKTVMSLLAK